MYAKVDVSNGIQNATLVGSDWVPLPSDLIGLDQATLNDLSVIGQGRPDLTGIGYWPVANDASAFVQNANMLDGTGAITLDTQTLTAARIANVRALTSDELTTARQVCKNALAEYRYGVETSGVIVSQSLSIKTDLPASAVRVLGASIAASQSVFPPTWKDFSGNWISVTPQDVQALIAACLNHTKTAFNNEYALSQQIDASTTPGSIDITQGWPPNPPPVAQS